MNVIKTVQDYITKMVAGITGMKVLVLDRETAGIVSLVYSQSQILQKEVYLFEKIDAAERESMPHLKAVCFLRPVQDNIMRLQAELKNPKYGEYHLFFSNIIRKSFLEDLAQADEHEVVQQVQEFFADYYAVNYDLFSLNIEHTEGLDPSTRASVIERMADGLGSILLSLRKKPVIRYLRTSDLARRVCEELDRRMQAEKTLFEFRVTYVPPLLLVLDRRDDPVTPLLMQWTYQAMVHELFTITNNRVDLSHIPEIREELKQIVLSVEQDPFFRDNYTKNFGDLGIAIKDLVEEFQKKTPNTQNIVSIEDMKRFVEEYPEFRKMQGNVSKHVGLMHELSHLVDQFHLMDVSALEQDLACKHEHSAAVKRVTELLHNPSISREHCLKTVLLYALRYESTAGNEIEGFQRLLRECGLAPQEVAIVQAMLDYAGERQRTGDLFSNKSILSIMRSSSTRLLKGVENVYTQHKPKLLQTLDLLVKGKLKDTDYPAITPSAPPLQRPNDLIIFIVGGATYEEEVAVVEFCQQNPGINVLLGGSTIHNSRTFLTQVARTRGIKFPLDDDVPAAAAASGGEGRAVYKYT